MDRDVGYLVDSSRPPLTFAAVQGVGEVLEHGLRGLERAGRDVSPIVAESRHRLVVLNLYEPEPVTVQILQHDGHLERMTEILGAGIGIAVLREVRRAVRALEIECAPLSPRFRNRVEKEKATVVMTYSLLKGDPPKKQVRLAEVLRRLQEKCRRESGAPASRAHPGDRSDPSFLFRLTFPKAVRELERAVREILSGSWERPVLEHVAEVASALADACRAEGLPETARVARSISSLVSAPSADLRAVEPAFRQKLTELTSSMRNLANESRGEAAP